MEGHDNSLPIGKKLLSKGGWSSVVLANGKRTGRKEFNLQEKGGDQMLRKPS